MEKNIMLVIPGAGDEAEGYSAPIGPGTTADAILRAAGKSPQDWQIELKRGEGFVAVGAHDDVFEKVQDGEKIFARPKDMVVG